MSLRTRSSSNGRTPASGPAPKVVAKAAVAPVPTAKSSGRPTAVSSSSSSSVTGPKTGASSSNSDPMLCDTYVDDDLAVKSSQQLDDFESKLQDGVPRPMMGNARPRVVCKPKVTNTAGNLKNGVKQPMKMGQGAGVVLRGKDQRGKALSEEEAERLQDIADVACLP